MRLWIDLDETKIETIQWVLKFFDNKLFGVLISKDDITNYQMSKIPGLQAKWITDKQIVELFDVFHLNAPIELIKPINQCRENLIRLKSLWAHITTVTARHKWVHNVTIDIIDTYFKWLIDDVIFADHYTANHKSKWLICRENHIDMMVDDNMDYAEELASKWVPVHVIDQPRNRHHDKWHESYGIYHHKDWDGIADAIIWPH
jgi:uncharacterized HAD superfamily protein